MRNLGLILVVAALAGSALAAPAAGAGHRLSAYDRRAINHTLDVLVNNGVKRHHVMAAYGIVTPELRAGMTRKEWASGSIPIYPYPARGATFHSWTIKYVTPDEVAVELMLMPRKSATVGPILFDVYLQPHHGKWLVDSFMPVATFAPLNAKPKVRALNDFMPGPLHLEPTAKGKISSVYMWIPFGVIGAALLALAVAFVFGGARYRPRGGALPPLPSGRRAQ